MTVASRHDVVVIGAGLAGLNAALTLQAAGLDVIVLEAQKRVGGRIHSMRQLGNKAEAGGTYIGAGYTRVIDTAERFGVELVDVTPILEFFREQDLVLGGQIIRQAEWPTHPANPFPAKDKQHMPWTYHRVLTVRENPLTGPGDWLDPRLGLSERAISLAYGMNVSFGRDANDVSALLLLFRGAFSKTQRVHAPKDSVGFTARDGVQRIPEAMAAALRREVALEHRAVSISTTRDAAEVRCADGSRFAGKHVIAALPFGVLREIAFDPPLAGVQAEAVAAMPAQPLTQVYLSPRTRFWEADGFAPSLFTDSGAGMIAAARNGEDPKEVTSIAAWIMGDAAAALDRLPKEQAGQTVIEAIERIRPAAKGQLEFLDLHSWGADPYARGAWAYYRPGEVNRFAGRAAGAHGRVHFCGEHLATANRGMEGAMETAERAAAEVLATA